MANKKLIGIVGWSTGEASFGASKPYMEYLKSFGTVIVLAPDTFIPELDLLVLPGGKDVAHGNAEEFSFYTGDHERFLETFDTFTLPKYIDSKTPILGICRGFQTLARTFGIPIYPNIYWGHGYSKDENQTDAHSLVWQDKTDYPYKAPEKTGSWHHQGVSLSDLENNEHFKVLATSQDGIEMKDRQKPEMKKYEMVEYMQHKTLPIIGIQSHPERNGHNIDRYLIHKIIRK